MKRKIKIDFFLKSNIAKKIFLCIYKENLMKKK